MLNLIVPIRQALVTRSLLEFCLLLIVAALFLLNGIFIILSCVNVWVPLFASMILFNYFNHVFASMILFNYFNHDIELYHCHGLWFTYCDACNFIFSSLKLKNRLKKHIRNIAEIKYGFIKLVVISAASIFLWILVKEHLF